MRHALRALGLCLPAVAMAAPGPPAPDSGTPALLEVRVTARRIEEDLQGVPMSVQALGGAAVDASRVTRLQELQFAVPGLVVNTTGMFGAGFSLRGVADQRVGGLSIAPYLDGVYLGSANLAIARLFDVERIEILKGPQGTLYGRNATAGALNVITQGPQDRLDAAVELGYGSFGTTRAQGHLNVSSGRAAARIAFIASEGDGYIRNTVDDRRFGEEDYWGLRGALRVEPNAALRIDLRAQHVRDDGGSGELWLPRPDFLPDPRDIRLTTVTLRNPYLVSEVDEVAAQANVDLGGLTLRSVTGYTRSVVRNVDDCAGLPVLQGCVRSALPNASEGWSQEFQLLLPRDGAFEALLGTYHADLHARLDFFQLLPLVSLQPLNDARTTTRSTTAALFGQATVHVGAGWSATAGLRINREDVGLATSGTGLRDSPTRVSAARREDDVSWRLDLVRSLGEDVTLYAGLSTGRKSGGFLNSTFIDGEPDGYGPESLTAFELGIRGRWLDRRLAAHAAAFAYDFEDMQVSTTSDTGVVQVDNAARAELQGLDASLDLLLRERWTVSAGVVWLSKREFVAYRNEATGDTLSGNDLVRAPEWSLSGSIGHERPLGGFRRLSARLEYNFRSHFFYSPENDPALAQGEVGLLNLFLRFEWADAAWHAFAAGRNLMNEDYFTQVLLQSSPGYPRTFEVGLGRRF